MAMASLLKDQLSRHVSLLLFDFLDGFDVDPIRLRRLHPALRFHSILPLRQISADHQLCLSFLVALEGV